ncbi:MAG: hypothetical protein ACOY94_26955 [Bacillota bacterium]
MERARHESFLVIKAGTDDMGSRPLTTPFASPEIQMGSDGRPTARIWNLGTREVQGVTTEFYSVPAGLPVSAENAQLIGVGNMAIIPAGQGIMITCNQVWRRMSHADVLLVMAYHPELDPVKTPFDALRDRHVGQMNYPWAGKFEGRYGPDQLKIRLEVRPQNQGLCQVKLFEEVNGRMPTFPKCDRIMKPNGHTFRWMEVEANRKDLYDLVMLDNHRMSFRLSSRLLDQPEASVQESTGAVERI